MLSSNPDDVYFVGLCESASNEAAVQMLRENLDCVHWHILSANPHDAAVDFLLNEHPDKLDWAQLSANHNDKAVTYLMHPANHRFYPEWDWANLSLNSNDRIVDMLLDNEEHIHWANLSGNPNPRAAALLLKNQDKIDWDAFARVADDASIDLFLTTERMECLDWTAMAMNPGKRAVELVRNHLMAHTDVIHGLRSEGGPPQIRRAATMWEKIKPVWNSFSMNPSDDAVDFIVANPGYMSWDFLCFNPSDRAISMLEKNRNRVDWEILSYNPNPLLWAR